MRITEKDMPAVAAEARAVTHGTPRFTRAEIKILTAGFPSLDFRSAAQRAEDLGCSMEALLQLEAASRDPSAHSTGVDFNDRSQVQSFGVRRG